jgi:hypothetical protein
MWHWPHCLLPAPLAKLPPTLPHSQPQGKENKLKTYADGSLFAIDTTTFHPLPNHPYLPCEEDVGFVQSDLERFRELRVRAGVRRPGMGFRRLQGAP